MNSLKRLRNDILFLGFCFFLFLIIVVLPAFGGYFTYSSDARTSYENGEFQLLDALWWGELPFWDPYNAQGRKGVALNISSGMFSPDLLFSSFVVEKFFSPLPVIYKSFIVTFIFRYFLIFGLGLWLLGRLLFNNFLPRAYLWLSLVFGTPLVMPFNNHMLSQLFIYFPWFLFFFLGFFQRKRVSFLAGVFLVAATIFLSLGRDFPLVCYSLVLVFIAGIFVFSLSGFKNVVSFLGKNLLILILGLIFLSGIAFSLKSIGDNFLNDFSKKRALKSGFVEKELTEEIRDKDLFKGELIPDFKSLIFPFPVLTPYYGHYHPGHSYLYGGLIGLMLLLFSLGSRKKEYIYFFLLLGGLSFTSAYFPEVSFYALLKKLIPGLSSYQYIFHLKYLGLFSLLVLEALGLEKIALNSFSRSKLKTGFLLLIFLSIFTVFLAAEYWDRLYLVKPWWIHELNPLYRHQKILVFIAVFLVITGRAGEFFLLKGLSQRFHKKFASLSFLGIEFLVLIFFLIFSHPVVESGWVSIRKRRDPEYFLTERPHNFTLHTVSFYNRPQIEKELDIGGVCKVNFSKTNHLQMKAQAELFKKLKKEKNFFIKEDSPRLFLASGIRLISEESLPDILNNSSLDSLLVSPLIIDSPLTRKIQTWLKPQESILTRKYPERIKIDIPFSRENLIPHKLEKNYTWIILKGFNFSRHLSSDPYIVKQEGLLCTVNGKNIPPNWWDISEKIKTPFFELNKDKPGLLKILAPFPSSEIKRIELSFRNPEGIHINNFGYNFLDLTYQADENSLLVYLDNYAPSWRARIDGKPTPVIRAYGIYKAIFAPRGKHRVVFSYRPVEVIKRWSFSYLCYISLWILFFISLGV